MNTKQLRQKILDLAIRGKLVPQDPNDEPASVLLERIRAEKERLIKEKKIKPDKKKSGAKSHCEKDVPFEVPESWEWAIISDVSTSIQYGYTGKAISEGKYKMLRITDIQNNSVDWASVPFVEIEDNKAKDYLLFDGNILFARTGATVGKSYLIENLDEKSVFASYLIRINASGSINERYLNHFLNSHFYWEQIMERSVGTGQPNVNGTILGELKIPIPPYVEQQRIVNEVESQFKLICTIEESEQVLDEIILQYKSKVLDLAIRGKLVPQDSSDEPASVLLERIRNEQKFKKTTSDKFPYPFEIPKNWEWCRLHDIADVSLGKTLDRLKNTGVFKCYLRSINVKWGIIDLSDVKEMKFEEEEEERYSLKYGDLLICEGGEAGRAAVWKYKDKSMRYQNAIHRVRFNFDFEADFYMYVFWHYHNSKILDKYSKGVTIKHLTGQALKQMRFPLPPIAEQKRIVSQIENMFFQLDIIEEALKA